MMLLWVIRARKVGYGLLALCVFAYLYAYISQFRSLIVVAMFVEMFSPFFLLLVSGLVLYTLIGSIIIIVMSFILEALIVRRRLANKPVD